MIKGHKISIKYIGIEKEDYLISADIKDVEAGFNLETKEGQLALFKKIEAVSGQKIQSMSWNKEPVILNEFIPLGLGACIIEELIRK